MFSFNKQMIFLRLHFPRLFWLDRFYRVADPDRDDPDANLKNLHPNQNNICFIIIFFINKSDCILYLCPGLNHIRIWPLSAQAGSGSKIFQDPDLDPARLPDPDPQSRFYLLFSRRAYCCSFVYQKKENWYWNTEVQPAIY